MAKKKRDARFVLRIEDDFHKYLVGMANDLGVGPNALMNLLLRRAVGRYQVTECWYTYNGKDKERTQVTLRIDEDLKEVILGLEGNVNPLICAMLYDALPP